MTDLLERLRIVLADRYSIERELGRGGMAVVYLARDEKLGREVALKVLRPELAASLGSERFLREIEIAAKLTHPNILGLYDCGEADGQLYYTMPFVEGESLRDRLSREKQLPIDDALQITNEVADALGHAHSLGIVHRDIKPENILFQGGHALVADFGIARAVSEAGAATLTETGLAVGTPAYMSPEQASGSKDIDARTDIHSLGCVLYEMLSGDAPYTASTPQAVIAKKLSEPLPRVSVVREAVPAAIETALTKSMARTPADRFATATQFTQALAVDTAAFERTLRTRRQLRRAAIGIAALVVVAGAALGISKYWTATQWKRVELDSNAVAIMPFEVNATDDWVKILREGIGDMLSDVLAGGGGLIATDQTSFLRAAADRRERGELTSPDAPIRLAAGFGAGQVIDGRVTQVGGQLTLNARLRQVPGGETVAQANVTGPVEDRDNTFGLVRQLAIELLGTRLGESEERLGDLVRRPVEAVTAYLTGTQSVRAGRYEEGIAHLQRALELDSSFALAALRIAEAPWLDYYDLGRLKAPAILAAQRDRSSLGARDQAKLDYLRIRYFVDTVSTGADRLRAVRGWLAEAPGDPEALVEEAAELLNSGATLGIRGWEEEAQQALELAWIKDSTTPSRVSRHMWVARRRGDLEWMSRVAPQYRAVADTSSDEWIYNSWVIALAVGDSGTLAALRARARAGDERVVNGMTTLWEVWWFEEQLGVAGVDGPMLLQKLRERAPSFADSSAAFGVEVWDAVQDGRFRDFRELFTGPHWRLYGNGLIAHQRNLIEFGLIYPYPGMDSLAALAADSLGVLVRLLEERNAPRAAYFNCFRELYRAAQGDTTGVRAAVQQAEPYYREVPQYVGLCPALVEAILEEQGPRTPGSPALDRLEALLRQDLVWEYPRNAAVPLLARMLRDRGKYERALAVARMQGLPGDFLYMEARVPLLKEEGDLAVIVGDTAGAIEAYGRYLYFRTDPDPGPVQEEVDQVREALTALLRAKG